MLDEDLSKNNGAVTDRNEPTGMVDTPGNRTTPSSVQLVHLVEPDVYPGKLGKDLVTYAIGTVGASAVIAVDECDWPEDHERKLAYDPTQCPKSYLGGGIVSLESYIDQLFSDQSVVEKSCDAFS